jgi:hypothetical protein
LHLPFVILITIKSNETLLHFDAYKRTSKWGDTFDALTAKWLQFSKLLPFISWNPAAAS